MASQQPTASPGTVFCRECGKAIEAGARFCRFCGRAQGDRPASTAAGSIAPPAPSPASAPARRPARTDGGMELWLRQLFPRHQFQDEFMHIGSIAVFLMALIGFVLGFFFAFNFLAVNFLLGSVALALFLMLRESTLSQMRNQATPTASSGTATRVGARTPSASDLPSEAATTQSSPPSAGRTASQK